MLFICLVQNNFIQNILIVKTFQKMFIITNLTITFSAVCTGKQASVSAAFSSDTKYGLRHPAAASHSLASRWPRPQQQLPISATGGGRCCCKPFHRPPYCPSGNRVPPQRTVLRETTDPLAGEMWLFLCSPFVKMRLERLCGCAAMKAQVGLSSR